jgi:hypothetical protein
VLLHASPEEAEVLREKGIEAALDRSRCLIELANEEDVASCERARIVFLVPPEVLLGATARLQEEVARDPAHAQASPELIAQAVRRRLKAVGGTEVFRATYGTATIQREVTLGDLGRHLEDLAIDANDQHAGELQARLAPYYGNGAYSAFFDGASNLPLAEAKLTDVELGQLAEQVDEHTFACIFTALIHHLTRYLLDPANRGRRKVLLIEEAWQYLKDNRLQPGAATVVGDALNALLRTARKHGVAIGLVTQNVTDLTATSAGREILRNIPIQILLRQSEAALDGAAEALKLTPEETAMLAGVRSEPRRYSQALLRAPEHSPRLFEIAVFIPHPVQYWLCTTRPEDITYREAVIERIQLASAVTDSEALQRAVVQCAERFPHGYQP